MAENVTDPSMASKKWKTRGFGSGSPVGRLRAPALMKHESTGSYTFSTKTFAAVLLLGIEQWPISRLATRRVKLEAFVSYAYIQAVRLSFISSTIFNENFAL